MTIDPKLFREFPGCEPFLRAIVAAYRDDVLPRLMFADWLAEHGWHRQAIAQRQVVRCGIGYSPITPKVSICVALAG
jgi:uncharacterized protein (TIGR02996 family)